AGVRRRRGRRRLLGRRVVRGQEGQGPHRAPPQRGTGVAMDTVLSSKNKTITIGSDKQFCVIGERINPTSRKKFSEELREGNLDTVVVDTEAQVEAGADMLDVNAGIPLVDEAELLSKMLTLIQATTDLPICIDSSVIEAL